MWHIIEAMQQPIKVRGRFASAYDTARTLGVSPSRTSELIATVKEFTKRVGRRDPVAVEFAHRKNKKGTRATVQKKSSGRNARATDKKTSSAGRAAR